MAFTVLGDDHYPSAGYAGVDAKIGVGDIHIAAEGAGPTMASQATTRLANSEIVHVGVTMAPPPPTGNPSGLPPNTSTKPARSAPGWLPTSGAATRAHSWPTGARGFH